jgi:diadenosine tetraphosphate (Ap4A) HIT family hydrolase
MSVACEFCTEIRGMPSRFSRLYLRYLHTRIVTETEHFLVLPSLGQLGVIHLLLVSREHATAVSNLSPQLREELRELVSLISWYFAKKFGLEAVVFENGDPQGVGNTSCSISHLHVHVVAVPHKSLALSHSIRLFSPIRVGSLDDLRGCRSAYSYLELSGDHWLIDRQLRSQTIRRLIAQTEASVSWDWRKMGRERKLVEIVHSMRGRLDQDTRQVA